MTVEIKVRHTPLRSSRAKEWARTRRRRERCCSRYHIAVCLVLGLNSR